MVLTLDLLAYMSDNASYAYFNERVDEFELDVTWFLSWHAQVSDMLTS